VSHHWRHMSSRADVVVVIPSWNSAALLRDCLPTLRDHPRIAGIVGVDNGSTDASIEVLVAAGADVIRFPTNRGFAVAVNAGVARAEAPYVLILNADTRLTPGCVETLANTLSKSPRALGVQPKILQQADDPRHRIYSAGQWLLPDGRAFEAGAGALDDGAFDVSREVFGVCGAACLMRRSALLEIGAYDESYFAFYEDVELNIRARLAGWSFEYDPNATIWHIGNASWQEEADRPRAFNARLVARNRLITSMRYLAPARFPGVLMAECGSVAFAARSGTLGATLRGKLEAVARIPEIRQERAGRDGAATERLLAAWARAAPARPRWRPVTATPATPRSAERPL